MHAIMLEQVLTCPNLPSLPAVAVEVLRLTARPNVELDEIAAVVQNDPALCARILKTVNSSFYHLSKPCPTMTRAIAYLGMNTVKSLVLGFSLVDWVQSGESADDLHEYWGRSLLAATLSRRMAALTRGCDPEEAFLVALMQDIGLLAMRWALGAKARDVVEQTRGNHMKLPELCHAVIGVEHAEVGAALATRWRLPENMVSAIGDHHCRLANLSQKPHLTQLVALCNHIVSAIGAGEVSGTAELANASSGLLGLAAAQVDSLIVSAIEDARELAGLLHVYIAAYPDVVTILAQAEESRLQHQLELIREAERLTQSNTDLMKQALSDPLTALGNRKHLDVQLAEHFNRARLFRSTLAFVMIDVDRFKAFNDSFGHPAGDAVLVELARRMVKVLQNRGIACRYGGEEFAIIMPDVDRLHAAALAESLRHQVQRSQFAVQPHSGMTRMVPVTVSVGVAVYDPAVQADLLSPALLIQAADRALLTAKQSGRNCVRIYGDSKLVQTL